MDSNLDVIKEGVSSLDDEHAKDISLALLNLLLPYQLRLDALKNESDQTELQELSEEFTTFVKQLRDALLS